MNAMPMNIEVPRTDGRFAGSDGNARQVSADGQRARIAGDGVASAVRSSSIAGDGGAGDGQVGPAVGDGGQESEGLLEVSWRASVWRWPRLLPMTLIRGYQVAISPLFGPSCRYYPCCSSYALTALSRHGLLRGSWLTVWRILRCNPWSKGGVDHVPDRGHRHHRTACEPMPDGGADAAGVDRTRGVGNS